MEQDVFIKPLYNVTDIAQLFELNLQEISQKSDAYMQQVKKVVDSIIAIPNKRELQAGSQFRSVRPQTRLPARSACSLILGRV